MEAQYLDHYSYLDSSVHRFPAHLKLAGAIAAAFLVLVLPVSLWPFHLAVALALLAMTFASRLPILQVLWRTRWLWLFVIALSAARLFHSDGVHRAISAVVTLGLWLWIALLLLNTTRFAELMQILTALNTPRSIVAGCWAAYRSHYAFRDAAGRTLRAARSRSLRKPSTKWWKPNLPWGLLPALVSCFLVRSADRSERIRTAMTARNLADV